MSTARRRATSSFAESAAVAASPREGDAPSKRCWATRRSSREVLPERATHVIDGEGEDPGGQHEAKSTTPRPRGREWRAALAKRINLER